MIRTSTLFFMFVLSGFSGLLYQVVWTRLAFASFGVNTPVLSVVISVFMAGLALGTWASGRWVSNYKRTNTRSSIFYYGLVECGIVVGALVVPTCFSYAEELLKASSEVGSFLYLTKSSILIGVTLLPWCFFMGCTYPLMAGYLKEIDPIKDSGFSFLYLGNVIGATLGVLATGFVFIELWGFKGTLILGGGLNLLVGVLALLIASLGAKRIIRKSVVKSSAVQLAGMCFSTRMSLIILFSTGFISMAMEVIWIRAFTPILGTTIYAFAAVLAVYLLATFLGTLAYRSSLRMKFKFNVDLIVIFLAIAAILPLVVSDPELSNARWVPLISIMPFCFLLGILTPGLVDGFSGGAADRIGIAYFANILGSIIGPLTAGYILLPVLGAKWSLLVLVTPFIFIHFLVVQKLGRRWVSRLSLLAASLMIVFSLVFSRTLEDVSYYKKRYSDVMLRRDYAATVISYHESAGDPMTDRLLVNGVGITHKTTITKLMAHLPMYYHGPSVENTLVICFGMGTTLRAMASWGVPVTAIELIPSVKEAFPYYFSDAEEVLSEPGVEVIIDDGRRYLRRTNRKFDVITIDPPPPVESAASSLLYSVEFYSLAASRLSEKGILQQWYPEEEGVVLEAMLGSLVKIFPHVRVFRSIEGWGYHFLASKSLIPEKNMDYVADELPERVFNDLAEWIPKEEVPTLFSKMEEIPVEVILAGSKPSIWISDDWPMNEYFFLRRGREFFARALTKRKTW